MLDYSEYTIDDNGYQGNGNGYHPNGYDQLDGDYALFYAIAKNFTHRVKPEDKEDFLHDVLLAMAKVKSKYDQRGKPLTKAGLIRVACYLRAEYWRKYFKRITNVDCSRCSKAQRIKCKEQDLYRECPKAIQLESLDRVIEDGNGNATSFYELIADDNAVDMVAMLDARFTIKGYPHKAIKLAYKKYAGYQLKDGEQRYLNRFRKKLQKTLISVSDFSDFWRLI